MQPDVSIVPCPTYDVQACREALQQVLAPLGGLSFIKPEMTVVIKLNLVSAMKPEQAATTHPSLVCALTQMLAERGARVILGDSPGGLFSSAYLSHVYNVTGLREAEACGAQLNDDFSQKAASFPAAKVCKSFTYTGYLDKADVLIDFSKLKSHGMMGMSNAAKNLFGAIPGTMKPEYHFRFPNAEDFADMIVDLDEYFHPTLCICDAVVAMEGNGPTQGTPKQIGALAASFSPHKLDLLCAKLLGLSVSDVPTLAAAHRRGLIPAKAEQLSVAGDYASLAVLDFHAPQAQSTVDFRFLGFSTFASKFLKNALTPMPKSRKNACIGCKKCAEICPAHAIEMKDKLPKINRSKCIHCFCCQEFCPTGAMFVYRAPIARLLSR